MSRRWCADEVGRIVKLSDRITRLEGRLRQTRSDPLTAHALDRMTLSELGELEALLQGADSVNDLPDEPRARVMELIDAASQRSHPAPWPASSAPGYDVMASIREQYEASQARRREAEHHS